MSQTNTWLRDMINIVLIISVVTWISGLLNPGLTVDEIQAAHPEWSTWICERMADGVVWLGMTQEQALLSWGRPTKINKTIIASGVRTQWVYQGKSPSNHLYFENGILTSTSS